MEFAISNKFTFKEYLSVQMNILYSKIWIKAWTIITVLYLISYLIFFILHKNSILNSDLYSFGLVLLVVEIYLPIFVFLICYLGFKKNPRFKELIIYHFSEKTFSITGESFNATFNWASFYKIQSTKSCLILYQSSMTANFVKLKKEDLFYIQQLKTYLESQNLPVKISMSL
ncbi:YcxB family protein [Mucilaginibacter aquaedulcis]|uniref:YcxB family protein n=1 Tax=Mucilaginibacter aquaedulcis TaxID=1187081 RepID=UPI00338D88FC